MEIQELEKLLRLGEDSTTEFKGIARSEYRIDPYDVAKVVSSLANTGGGRILLGVEDDSTVTGVGTIQQADAAMRQVVQACQQNVHPPIICRLTKLEHEGVLLLLVTVPGFSPDRPYRAGHVHYVRDGSVSREATRDELARLFQSASSHFDEEAVTGATKADLDLDVARHLLVGLYDERAVAEQDRYLNALRCIDAQQTPTVSGVLMLGRDPQRWLVDARISAVRFPGATTSLEFKDRKEISGRLPEQVEGALTFLEQHLSSPSRVEGFERVELGIPREVLREAVLNAVAHRDYRAASQIRIFVFDDRVELINPGALLNFLTLDSIRIGGVSQRRNPVLASLLARRVRRENLGIGFPEMIRMMRERGLPEPELSLEGGHFRLVLRMKAP